MASTLLKVSDLKVAYGGIQAVKGVSFEVRQGELVSLIGANGAGKTTTLKAITGIQPVAAGEVEFMGRPIKAQGAWDLVRQGLVMVPEGRGVFARMTITEHLQMGAFVRGDTENDDGIGKEFGYWLDRRHHGKGYMTLYAFNQSVDLGGGGMVKDGEVVASVGQSGGRSHPGLYFGIRNKGKPVDPLEWCRK